MMVPFLFTSFPPTWQCTLPNLDQPICSQKYVDLSQDNTSARDFLPQNIWDILGNEILQCTLNLDKPICSQKSVDFCEDYDHEPCFSPTIYLWELTLFNPGGGADLPPASRICVYAGVYAHTRANFF